MATIENCNLCFNKFEEESIYSTPKLRELCYKYLHSSLTQETLLHKTNSDEVPFCVKCFEFMEEVAELNEKLECFQKRISELVFIRSLEILYRRGKHPGHPKGSTKQNRSNYRKSQRQLIEFDVSEFPNCEFKNTCSDITESIETSTDYLHNFNSPSVADICDDDEELKYSLDIPSCDAKVKVEIDEFSVFDENEESNAADSFINKTKSNSDVSVGDNINKTQNPILKLQKLVLSDSCEEIILMRNEQSSTGNNKHGQELQTTWIKRNCGSYKLTAANEVNTSANFHNSDSDEQISMMEASATNSSTPKLGDGLKLINNETFQCVLCDEEFPTEDELEVHKIVHPEEHAEKSDVDENKFNSKGHLLKHKRIHANKSTYKCDLCKKAFSMKHYLLSHKVKIHQLGNWPFNCDFCGKGFHIQTGMKRHRRIHTGERPYTCEFCGKGYKERSHLATHIKNHTGEKPYKCEICGKKFTQQGSLISHSRIHTGERPYQCEICGKNFAVQKCLVAHRKIHSGEKPHKCDVCGRGFVQSYSLKVHMRTHTEEKPFNCEVCGRGFVQKKNMLTHKCQRRANKKRT